MTQSATQRGWQSALPLFGGIGLAVLTVVCYRLHLNLATTALLYLVVIVLVSVGGSLAGSLAVSALAIGLLHYFFAPPVFHFEVKSDVDVALLVAFGLTVVVITSQASRARRSLHQLQALRNELELVIDTIPVLAWSNLPDGTVAFLNRRWLEYTGLSAEDVQRGRWTAALHPDEAPRLLEERAAAIASGKPYAIEGLLRRADGEYRWVLRRVVPLHDAEGKIIKWYGTGTDIEDFKRTERALRRSEAYLAEAQRLSHTGSFGWDPSRAELRWSEETFQIFEYDSTKVTPTLDLVLQRVHPEDLDLAQHAIDRATREQADWDLDHRLLMPDCRVKHVHVVARAIRHASGTLEFVGAVMDVTAAKSAQAELQRSEAYLTQAERLSHTGSWARRIGDPDDEYWQEQTYWSAEGYRIFGVDPTTEARPTQAMRDRVHPDDWPHLVEAAQRAIREGSNFEADYRAVLPDGSIRYIQTVGGPVINAAGQVTELVGTVMDVTERKRAERAIRRARERALAARFSAVLEERSRLAREMHDTLLQGFTGVALQLVAVAQRVAGPPETVAAFRDLIGLAQRTLAEARHAVWSLRAPALPGGDFPSGLRKAAEDALRGSGLALTYEVVGSPKLLGSKIEVVLARVLQEAIANTVKHANARTVRVHLLYKGRGLCLTVADDGGGFLVDSDFRAYGGHWGLLGMKERAGQLRGTLQVESAPGQGTTIVVRIPYSLSGSPSAFAAPGS